MGQVLNLKIDLEDAIRLDNLAELTSRPKSFYVRKLIHDYLAELEDIYLSEQALEETRAGAKTYDTTELRKELLEN